MLADVRRALPGTHVALMGVLPRGAALVGRDIFTWPNRFTRAIAALNARYEVPFAVAEQLTFVLSRSLAVP